MYFECFLFVKKYDYKNVCICMETKKQNFAYKLKIYEFSQLINICLYVNNCGHNLSYIMFKISV